MPEPKSECVDSEQYHNNGANVAVYRALVPIPCYRCQQNIMPGTLFRRSANKNGSTVGIRYSFCRKCEPFERKPQYCRDYPQPKLNESQIQEQLLIHKLYSLLHNGDKDSPYWRDEEDLYSHSWHDEEQDSTSWHDEEQDSTYWRKVAKSPIVRIQLNKQGNAYFTNELGLPLLRSDVTWIMHAAKKYLELYSDVQIQARWQELMDKL